MATVNLTNPIPGTGAVAGLIAGNNTAIQTCLNGGVDNANIAAAGVANIDPLKLAGWVTYVPTLSASGGGAALGNGSISGRYTQIGKFVHARVLLTLGSTTTFGTGTVLFSMPATSVNYATETIGTGTAIHSASVYGGFALWQTTTTVAVVTPAQPLTVWSGSNAIPFSWTTGDQAIVHFSYEAA